MEEEFLLILPETSLTTSVQRAQELLEVRKLRIVYQGSSIFRSQFLWGVSRFS